VNKAQLIEALADRLGGKRAANDAVDTVLDTIQRAVAKGERVAITGFGVFERIERPARLARNPATGEKVRVKKTTVPKFKPGQGFKDVVSGAKKLPKVAASTARAATVGTTATATRATGKASTTGKRTAASKTATKPATRKSAAAKPSTAKATTARKAPAKSAAKKSTVKKTTVKRTTKPASRRG